MATLTLDRLWLNLMSTGEGIASKHKSMPDELWNNEGDVRTYAGGRQRAVSVEGEVGTFSFVLLEVNNATWDKLRSWKTLAVQVRDMRGRRFFGVFFSVTKARTYPIDLPICALGPIYDVAVTLRVVTMDEGS